MARYQKGDTKAFEILVARHETRLWSFLRRFVGDPATAEDLLQEVFLRVVRNAGEWQPSAKFTTWVYTIARNLCTDHARRQVHRKAASLDGTSQGARGADDSGPVPLDRLDGGDPGGESRAADREMLDRLDAALSILPEEQREVFLMREVMDMPFAEIAGAVGATEPTVKSRMRYALEKLRDALADFRDTGRAAVAAAMSEAET